MSLLLRLRGMDRKNTADAAATAATAATSSRRTPGPRSCPPTVPAPTATATATRPPTNHTVVSGPRLSINPYCCS